MSTLREDPANPLQVKVMVPVMAKLVLQLPDGTTRPPFIDELHALRLKPQTEMYERMRGMLAKLRDDEDDPTVCALRYFVEHITKYDHEEPDEAIEGLRARLIWD